MIPPQEPVDVPSEEPLVLPSSPALGPPPVPQVGNGAVLCVGVADCRVEFSIVSRLRERNSELVEYSFDRECEESNLCRQELCDEVLRQIQAKRYERLVFSLPDSTFLNKFHFREAAQTILTHILKTNL